MRNLYFIFIALLLTQCARQSQPAGGPQDKEPPVLESSIPVNGQKNFKGKNIELTFDELVKLKDPQEEIIIIPSIGTKTKFTARKTKVIITPEKNWSDTTTYSIAFRGAIQDMNEGNTTDDLHLAFSTGPNIDSMSISGSIAEVFKEKIPEKITIGLYQSDTFDIFKHKPTYFSKSDKAGNFSIQNLKAGKYFVYAFDDKNKNSKVDSKSERFGFYKKEIQLRGQKDSVHIDLFKVDTRPIKVTSVRNTSSISTIRLNKPVSTAKLSSDNSKYIYTYGDDQSEIVIYKEFNKSDSLLVHLHASDSLSQQIDTAVYVKYTDNKKLEESFKMSEWQLTYTPETKSIDAKSTTNKLLLSANYDSIYIQIDTANYQIIKPEELTFDTLTKTVHIKTIVKTQDKENAPIPVLLFGKGALVSLDKDSSKSKDVKINIPKPKSSGSLSVQIKTKQPHFEIQLQESNGKLVKSIRDQLKYVFKLLAPTEYRISVIVDSNNNGKWDTGDFRTRTEPEQVILYKNSENKFTFPIRANWEVGPLVISF